MYEMLANVLCDYCGRVDSVTDTVMPKSCEMLTMSWF